MRAALAISSAIVIQAVGLQFAYLTKDISYSFILGGLAIILYTRVIHPLIFNYKEIKFFIEK